MSLLDSLERRFGHLAIPGLIRIVVALNALVYMLGKLNPAYRAALTLNPAAVAEGEVWRLVTFLFVPETDSPIWIVLFLLFLWNIGSALEMVWGAFRLNLFYLIGMVGTAGAAMLFGAASSAELLNLSLLFAYAWFFPNAMLVFPPIPMRWLAWILLGFLLISFVGGPMAYKAAVVASLSNLLIFFGPGFIRSVRQREVASRRKAKFEAAARTPEEEAMHRCAACGRTERSHPELDFRVSRDGHEYCTEHLPARQP